MTEGPITPTKPRGGLGLRFALAVSVALNLAVVGVVGGAMLRHDGPHDQRVPRDLGFGFYGEALTPEDRAELRRRFVRSRPALLQERRDMRQDLTVLLTALRAEPFDPKALDVAMQAQIDRLERRLTLGQNLLRDFIVDLDPAERRAFADRLETAAFRRAAPVKD